MLPGAVVGGTHLGQAPSGLSVEPAVPALGTKTPLEGSGAYRLGARGDAVTDGGEIGERTCASDEPNPVATSAGEIGRRLRPDPHARAGKPGPVEELAGV